MSEKIKNEKEGIKRVELKIVEPRGDKNFMIGFDGKTVDECRAYNWAIETVLKEAKLSPFHQVGVNPRGEHEPGYHAWELWQETTRENLEKLLLLIDQKVQEML